VNGPEIMISVYLFIIAVLCFAVGYYWDMLTQ